MPLTSFLLTDLRVVVNHLPDGKDRISAFFLNLPRNNHACLIFSDAGVPFDESSEEDRDGTITVDRERSRRIVAYCYDHVPE